MSETLALCVVPQEASVIQEGIAIVEHQTRATRKPRDQPVPHHPATGREVEQAISFPNVGMQAMFLEVLQQGAARTVHDALWNTRGTRGVHYVERMREG